MENLAFFLGESWLFALTAKDPAGELLALNAPGTTVTLEVRVRGGAVILTNTAPELSTGADDGVQSEALFTVTPAQQTSAGVADRVYDYSIKVALPNGVTYGQARGHLTVTRLP